MNDLGNKMQSCIQLYSGRPYGVGLIVAGYDDLGPHIYQVSKIKNSCLSLSVIVNISNFYCHGFLVEKKPFFVKLTSMNSAIM